MICKYLLHINMTLHQRSSLKIFVEKESLCSSKTFAATSKKKISYLVNKNNVTCIMSKKAFFKIKPGKYQVL